METRHRDLMGAPVCGLIVGAFQQNTADSGEFHFDSFVRCVTLAIGSYSVVSLWLSWKVHLTQRVPAWILTALLGSSIYYFFIHLLDTVTYAWRFRATQPELSLPQYVLNYFHQFITGLFVVTIMDGVLALIVMGTIHYAGSRLTRAWRKRPSEHRLLSGK